MTPITPHVLNFTWSNVRNHLNRVVKKAIQLAIIIFTGWIRQGHFDLKWKVNSFDRLSLMGLIRGWRMINKLFKFLTKLSRLPLPKSKTKLKSRIRHCPQCRVLLRNNELKRNRIALNKLYRKITVIHDTMFKSNLYRGCLTQISINCQMWSSLWLKSKVKQRSIFAGRYLHWPKFNP